jgi:hypothetical protein
MSFFGKEVGRGSPSAARHPPYAFLKKVSLSFATPDGAGLPRPEKADSLGPKGMSLVVCDN